MTEKRVVVVGAGVAGLTSALLLSKNPDYRITVVAKHMPGDYDIEYASPWAGANYLPVSAPGTDAASHDASTWPELSKLATHHPEAGVHFQEVARYNRTADLAATSHSTHSRTAEYLQADSWFRNLVPNFRSLSADELPPGYSSGTAFTSVCIDTALYLPYLKSQCLKAGVVFKRAVFAHISQAASAHQSGLKADLVVNCTGLSARTLGGVEDTDMVPARGQTVLVRNEAGVMCDSSGTEDGDEEVCYVMQRAAGGGTLLGGSYQKGNWDSQVDPNLSIRIMKRAVELCPSLTGGKGIEGLDVIRYGVGLRPVRTKGTRLERERVGAGWVVHNYGHGGYGYQSSYGCAQVVVELVRDALVAGERGEVLLAGLEKKFGS